VARVEKQKERERRLAEKKSGTTPVKAGGAKGGLADAKQKPLTPQGLRSTARDFKRGPGDGSGSGDPKRSSPPRGTTPRGGGGNLTPFSVKLKPVSKRVSSTEIDSSVGDGSSQAQSKLPPKSPSPGPEKAIKRWGSQT